VTEDGRRILNGSGTLAPQDGPMSIRFEVDPRSLEYSAFQADASPAEITAERDRSAPPDPHGDLAVLQDFQFKRTVSVATLDPVLILLTRTVARLGWNTNAGSVLAVSPGFQCFAANPSALGTHWSNDSCSRPQFDFRPANYCIRTIGAYTNFDFMNDTAPTRVAQQVHVCGNADGFATFDFSHEDSGEGSELIFGQFNVVNE
jgi:hypothetical protein